MKLVKASPGRLALLILFTVGLFGCDYATKSAAKATLEGTDGISVAPDVLHGAVELRYVENEDIAFSVLRRLGIPRSPELLITLAIIALAILVIGAIFAWRAAREAADGASDRVDIASAEGERGLLLGRAGLALIVSGALGNLVDRVWHGYVIDFFLFHLPGWSFAIFNLADVFITLGAGLVILDEFLVWRRARRQRG